MGEITKSVLEHEQICPELKYIMDEYDYQATHMILAAGHRMRQIYDFNMGKAVKMPSIEKLAEKYTVNPTHLFEMLKGSKYGQAQKSTMKGTLILDIDTEVDAAMKSTEQAIQQAKLITRRTEPAMSEVEADRAEKVKSSPEEVP